MGNIGYVITPSDFTQEPIELSQKDTEKYEQYVSEELAKYIDTIQFGLSFFGIMAQINEENKNQIDFYDENNNLLHSKIINAPKNKTELIEGLLKAQFSAKFRTNLGEFSWKSEPINEGENSENYYFNLNCGDYSKSIVICRRDGKISSIEAQINGKEDFNIKKLSVSNINGEMINFELDDVFGSKGNHEEGKVRKLYYNKSKYNNDIYACISEAYAHEKNTSLESSHTSWDGEEKDRIITWNNNDRKEFIVPSIKMLDYITKILSHPRSKEIITYLEGEIEKEFPGMIDFINSNFNAYNKIKGLTYETDPEFEELHNSVILPECDLPVTRANLY